MLRLVRQGSVLKAIESSFSWWDQVKFKKKRFFMKRFTLRKSCHLLKVSEMLHGQWHGPCHHNPSCHKNRLSIGIHDWIGIFFHIVLHKVISYVTQLHGKKTRCKEWMNELKCLESRHMWKLRRLSTWCLPSVVIIDHADSCDTLVVLRKVHHEVILLVSLNILFIHYTGVLQIIVPFV